MVWAAAMLVLVVLLPAVSMATESPGVRRVGVLLHDGAPPGLLESFRDGLRDRGYVEGKNIAIDLRDAEGKNDRLAALADELVRLNVDLILALNTPSALAAKKATTRIPIVITRVTDPVKSGLVASLARPGGNVTGLFKGGRPSELPLEEPSEFDLVVNLKTAKALGLAIPTPVLLRANHVIE